MKLTTAVVRIISLNFRVFNTYNDRYIRFEFRTRSEMSDPYFEDRDHDMVVVLHMENSLFRFVDILPFDDKFKRYAITCRYDSALSLAGLCWYLWKRQQPKPVDIPCAVYGSHQNGFKDYVVEVRDGYIIHGSSIYGA